MFTDYHAKYFAYELTHRRRDSAVDRIGQSLFDGDNNIAIPRDSQGNPMEQDRVQLIEDAVKRWMFADTEAGHKRKIT